MTNCHTPPGRTSICCMVVRNPRGPHHCTMCRGSVHIVHTSSRGASKTRLPAISRSLSTAALATMFLFLLFLQLLQVFVESIETFLPELAVVIHPAGHFFQRPGVELAGTPLRVAAARDEPGPLQHLEMLRHRGEAHVERLGQLGHRRLAFHQTM